MYNDKLQKKLEHDLKHIYNQYSDTINIQIYDQMLYNWLSKVNKFKENYKKVPLVTVVINNYNIIVNNDIRYIYKNDNDQRLEHIIILIKKTIKWAISNNLTIPDTQLYFWISDTFPYHTDNLNEIPIFVYARPNNIMIPIFPDITFTCFQMEQKYKGKCYDWDETKNIINKYNSIDFENKNNIIYFKGAPTTKTSTHIREKLEKSNITNIPLDIKLDAFTNYEPIYNLTNYKYLLNLPGHFPWSNRLKYLFLTKSLVINVSVYLKTDNYIDHPYITFIDYIISKKNYININYIYYKTNDITKMEETNNIYFNKFINKLYDVYLWTQKDKNKNKIKKIIDRAYTKISKLNNHRIYQYVYKCILYNSSIKFI